MEKFLGKVIGEFICDDIFIMWDGYAGNRGEDCLTFDEREKYLQGNNGYGWHISNLKIYDEPKELNEFYKKDFKKALCYWEYLFSIDCVDDEPEPKEEDYILTKAPQSWCYVIKEN